MYLPNQNISDQHIFFLLATNDPQGWESFYDKYAPAMYGIIYNLANNKTTAEEIFTEVFLQLKEKQFFSNSYYPFCSRLLRYTYSFAIKRINRNGISRAFINSSEETKVMQLLCSSCNSLIEVSSVLNITVEEAKKKLHLEFLDTLDETRKMEF